MPAERGRCRRAVLTIALCFQGVTCFAGPISYLCPELNESETDSDSSSIPGARSEPPQRELFNTDREFKEALTAWSRREIEQFNLKFKFLNFFKNLVSRRLQNL